MKIIKNEIVQSSTPATPKSPSSASSTSASPKSEAAKSIDTLETKSPVAAATVVDAEPSKKSFVSKVKGALSGLKSKTLYGLSAAGASIKSAAIGVKNSVSNLAAKANASFKNFFNKAPKIVDGTPSAGNPGAVDAEKADKLGTVNDASAAASND